MRHSKGDLKALAGQAERHIRAALPDPADPVVAGLREAHALTAVSKLCKAGIVSVIDPDLEGQAQEYALFFIHTLFASKGFKMGGPDVDDDARVRFQHRYHPGDLTEVIGAQFKDTEAMLRPDATDSLAQADKVVLVGDRLQGGSTLRADVGQNLFGAGLACAAGEGHLIDIEHG